MRRAEFIELRKRFSEKPILELVDLLSADDLQTRFVAETCPRDATST